MLVAFRIFNPIVPRHQHHSLVTEKESVNFGRTYGPYVCLGRSNKNYQSLIIRRFRHMSAQLNGVHRGIGELLRGEFVAFIQKEFGRIIESEKDLTEVEVR